MNQIDKAKEFAINAHRSTNHLYDGKPYEIHLELVVKYADRYKDLITTDYSQVISAAWLHDTIEDCRVTYNDIKQQFGVKIAELVFALTNEKGRTRKDRANGNYYAGIRAVPDAAFVKICDRLANISYSVSTGSSMARVYKKESLAFAFYMPARNYISMFAEIEQLLTINP